MNKFILQNVLFESNSWRKLSNINIPIYKRLTVIAGHNGIGKSSILGFIANTSGKKSTDLNGVKSYFGTDYMSKFEEQFRLSPDDISTNNPEKGNIVLTYKNGDNDIIKKCNIGVAKTKNGSIRFRVVPRSASPNTQNYGVPQDGKIPMPTLFVSAARTWPIGECPKVDIKNSDIDIDDAEYIRKCHNYIIPGEALSNETSELDLGFSKTHIIRNQHPRYKYDATTISLGQGAIASIITALVSFYKLKKILNKNYVGGILLIDEIEAGLHPRAQIRLADLLLREGKSLNLQIITTTHSLVFLEKIYNVQKGELDGIVYLMDTQKPCVKTLSLQAIRDEMLLSKTAYKKIKKPVIYIYTEDQEALFFLKDIIRSSKDLFNEKQYKVQLKKAPLKIGCGQLIKLVRNKTLSHFSKFSLAIVDGDQKNEDIKDLFNCIKLPTSGGALVSPEEEIFRFLSKALDDKNGKTKEREALINQNISWDFINTIITTFNDTSIQAKEKQRDKLKKWFNNIAVTKRHSIISAWINVHQEEIKGFSRQYNTSLAKLVRLIS